MTGTPTPPRRTRILIVGSGFAGIGMAIRLRQQGIEDFVILERASDLGGTWRDNRYPGCACDVQSALYSFSFAPNPAWSRVFAPQEEIWAYLRRCAETYGIVPKIEFAQEVTQAVWDDREQHWLVTTNTQQWVTSMLIVANGPLSDPVTPALPGLDTFRGPVFHSAQWEHAVPLRDQRVAVIGTGASAIQFIPMLQPQVRSLHVFQRTAPWIVPRRDRGIPLWRRSLYRAVPALQRLVRSGIYAFRELTFAPFRRPGAARLVQWIASRHRAAHVADPALRAALTPTYTIGCKRILLSDDYYPAMSEPNVRLITSNIAQVTADGVVTADGHSHAVDVIIFGTGFRATDPPLAPHIIGRNGKTLADHWRGSPSAYMGIAVSGFPNLCFLLGPNTGLGHSSVVLMIEAQIEHILGLLALMRDQGSAALEPTPDAEARYVRWIDARLADTVWNSGGCKSWYLDSTGRNAALWPERVGRYRRMASHVRAADYRQAPVAHEHPQATAYDRATTETHLP